MLKAIILSTQILLLCGCSASSPAVRQEITGRWEGVAEIQDKKTKAVVDFLGGTGNLRAVISVPDERLLSKPLINVRYEPPKVHFELHTSERTIIFDGSRNGEVISGTIRSGEISAPLSLRHVGTVPPTPYKQEEVRFRNGDVTLAGTLLLPPTKGRHPAVILIHGSSTPSRNDFRFYGDLFARKGIAALIYDKRAGADLSGASRVDLRDLAADALAAVALLKNRDDIDPIQSGCGDTARVDGLRRLLLHNQRMSRSLSAFPDLVLPMPKSTNSPMQIGSAPTAFLTQIYEKRRKRSHEWMNTPGEAGMNTRSKCFLIMPRVNPGRLSQRCPGECRVLTRFTPGYDGAILI